MRTPLAKEGQRVRGTFQRAGHPSRPIHRPTRWVPIDVALQFINALEADQTSAWSVRNGLIARLMLESGLRVTEVAQFPLSDLPDVDARYAFALTPVTGKGKKQRLIAIPIRLLRDLHAFAQFERASLAKILKQRRQPISGTLFITHSGVPLTRGWIEKIFRSKAELLGLRITPHMLRHTFGTYHYHMHKDLPLLRSLMGHSSMETTERFYVHSAVLSGYSAEFEDMIRNLGGRGEKGAEHEN